MKLVRVALLFTLLTAVMTWPQAAHMTSGALDHQDVFFNMWRFAWFAHALATSPAHILDGNIFYPERRTLTFSDAMPVESLVAAPLLWSGLPPVLVHNVMLLGGIVLSAVGIFVLARRLTGSGAAGITAGIIFAFAPYRFEHYMHMELQWIVWTPWAFWALHRAIDTGERCYGLLAGASVALQMLSSVYYGIFLALVLGLSALLLLAGARDRRQRALTSLLLGAVVATAISAAYALPYLATRKQMGGRPQEQIVDFSAKPSSYLVATAGNYLYGAKTDRRGRPERRLFPGVLPCLLAVFGLLAARPSREAIVYVIALVAAFEMSLGFYGYSYRFLYEHVSAFEGLRAPARLGIFVVFFLGLLAAYGHAALERALALRWCAAAAVVIAAVLLLEYWVAPLPLTAYSNNAPPLYAWLAQLPHGVVLELPVPRPDTLPGDEARYSYMSTFHWMPLLNGYSGFYPDSYIARISSLRHFPSDESVARLKREGLRYIIVHTASYRPDDASLLLSRISANSSFTELGSFSDGRADASVFALR